MHSNSCATHRNSATIELRGALLRSWRISNPEQLPTRSCTIAMQWVVGGDVKVRRCLERYGLYTMRRSSSRHCRSVSLQCLEQSRRG